MDHKRLRKMKQSVDTAIPLEEGDSMYRKLKSNTLAKKTSIFVVFFAVTCILLGNRLHTLQDEESLLSAVTNAVMGGQAVEAEKVKEIVPSHREMPFPLSGEYPSLLAEPLPVKPQIEIILPTVDGFTYSQDIPLSIELQQFTYSRCVRYGLEYELVLALMWRESRFQVDAVNINTDGTQDSGIMQINDVNREWLNVEHGIEDLMDPMQNITAGTLMLSMFIERYGVHDGLMAYQYGEQGMQQKFEQGIVTNDNIAILLDKRNDFKAILQQT